MTGSTAAIGSGCTGMGGGADTGVARAVGRKLRKRTPRRALACPVVPAERRDPVDVVVASNAGRRAALIPLRIGRMVVGPFAFLRGSAGVMAADLVGTAVSGISPQICGDAHVANVGFYASPERRMALDINDFDETIVGPWEYDLKRLLVSVVVAGREAGIGEDKLTEASRSGVRAYRRMVATVAVLPAMQAWSLGFDEQLLSQVGVLDLGATLRRVLAKAERNDSAKAAEASTRKVTERDWHFVEDPPILSRVSGSEREAVTAALVDYRSTLGPDRQVLLSRFRVVDVALRVVGVGSVGTRAYVVLLHGPRNDPLILQVKQARQSVYADFLGVSSAIHQGRRVVQGQRLMQTVSDPLLGWTTIDDVPYLVRTFRDRKGSVEVTALSSHELIDYAQLCGALLARAHCRSTDPRVLSAYLGKAKGLANALAEYARAYADVVEADHGRLVDAVRSGRLPTDTGK